MVFRRDEHPEWDNREIQRGQFFRFFRKRIKEVKPKFVRLPKRQNLFDKRNAVLAIREAARRKRKVRFMYNSIQTGNWKSYLVEAYSFRIRRTRDGRKRVLFAYHTFHKRIHMFIVERIGRVFITNLQFRSRWRVEIR